MTAPHRHHLILVFVTLAVALAALLWPAPAPAQSGAPSLRLIGPAGEVTLHRFKGRVPLEVRTWIAATDGAFELRVARPDYDTPPNIVQVDSVTGAVVRDLPEDVLDDWSGLAGFVEVVLTGGAGQEVAARSFTFCPNGWEHQRVDDSGPELPRYPTFCGSFSPFTKGWSGASRQAGLRELWAAASSERRGSTSPAPGSSRSPCASPSATETCSRSPTQTAR